MASEMIQRVACGIATALIGYPVTPSTTWEGGPAALRGKPVWEGYATAARAAIEAMRAPTEEMVKAGKNTPTGHSWGMHATAGSSEFAESEPIWQAMIDAALKE